MDDVQDIHVSSTEVHHHESREQQQFHYEENEGGSTIVPLTVESLATTHDGHSHDQKHQQNNVMSNNTCFDDIANDNVVVDDSDNGSEEDEVDEEDNDEFDCDAIAMPRLTSSTVPIVIDVSNHHRNVGFYSSNDPLFQGVCLYSTTATGKSTTTTTAPIRDHNDPSSNGHGRNGSTNLSNTIATSPIGHTGSSWKDEVLMRSNESCTTSVSPSSTKRSCEEIYHWYIPPSVFRLFVKNR